MLHAGDRWWWPSAIGRWPRAFLTKMTCGTFDYILNRIIRHFSHVLQHSLDEISPKTCLYIKYIHGTCYLTSWMPSINSPTLSGRWWQVSHIFCGMFTPEPWGNHGWLKPQGSSPSRITRPQRCGVLHPVRRRLRVNDVVDVVKMFLGGDKMVVSPDLGREIRKSRICF